MTPRDNGVDKSPTLAQMLPPARVISLDYWEAGYVEGHAKGWDSGYRAAWDELAEKWGVHPIEDQRAYADARAKAVDYPALCERRGEHALAAKIRAAYRLLGILPAPVDGEG